jgi:hypothetical protein
MEYIQALFTGLESSSYSNMHQSTISRAFGIWGMGMGTMVGCLDKVVLVVFKVCFHLWLTIEQLMSVSFLLSSCSFFSVGLGFGFLFRLLEIGFGWLGRARPGIESLSRSIPLLERFRKVEKVLHF